MPAPTIILTPDYNSETELLAKGYRHIAGIDEAGRGPLAGPVVAAAVILNGANIPTGLNDSKKLTAKRREQLFDIIMRDAVAVSIASISAETIDKNDIRKSALAAMRIAAISLNTPTDFVLIDGRDIPADFPCPAAALIKGDQRSVSIAAASIIAKVMRDRMMHRAGQIYPAYGFEKHAGYGTKMHREAIAAEGPVRQLHRYSFSPVKGLFTR